jgi:hypothetical protein
MLSLGPAGIGKTPISLDLLCRRSRSVAPLTESPYPHAPLPAPEVEVPFKQGVQPCLVVPKRLHKQFRGDLLALGYQLHTGPRTTRDGEVQAWVAGIDRGRQVHIQEVRLDNGDIAVFAHTEPEGYGLDHLISAMLDGASFSGGAKVLKNDLRCRGWDV